MKWGRFLAAGVCAGIVISIASYIVSAGIQAVSPYNMLALGGIRGASDPMMLAFFAYPFVLGFAMAALYTIFKKSFSGNDERREVRLGLAYWLVYSVPSAFVVFTSMDYPVAFEATNLIGTFIGFIAAAYVIVRLMK